MNIPSVTVQQMKQVDEIMINDLFVSVLQIMENAGRLLAKLAVSTYNPKTVTILVGPGNNGGGGLVATRYLHNYHVEINVVTASKTQSSVGKRHLQTVKALNIPVSDNIQNKPDLFIDALLGYGALMNRRGV